MKKLFPWFILTLIITLIGAGCSLQDKEQETETAKPVPVIVQKVEKKHFETTERYVGQTKASQDVYLISKMTGKVEEVYVKQGDTVKEDQVIIKLDDQDAVNSLRQAQAGYESALNNLLQAKERQGSGVIQAQSQFNQAKLALEQAKTNLERTKQLYESEAVTKSQLEQAEAAYNQAQNSFNVAQDALDKADSTANIGALESAVEQAKIGVEQAQRAVTETKIKAPIAGKIASINVGVGDIASPQSPIGQMVSTENMIVQLNITETSLKLFTEGKELEVNVPSISKSFKGKITFVAPAANQTMSFPVEISVENPEHQIKPGMLVEVKIITAVQDEIVIPTKAIIGSGQDAIVYIVKDGKAEKRSIKIKEMSTDETMLEAGVKEGESLIIKGQYYVEDGSAIETVTEEGNAS